jgi:hypothetical protein
MGIRPLMCIVLLAASAQAAPMDDAKAAFQAGKEAFERGEYENALANFLRANQLVPAPSLQYNIGNCQERLARYAEAAAAFERYLELAGPPTTDDEKDFQEKLRARIVANRNRASQAQPPPPPVYQQPTYQPPPTYYVPPAPEPVPRDYLLRTQRARRTRAIALMATGVALNVLGIAFLIDGLTDPHGNGTCDIFTNVCSSGSTTSGANIAEDFFGITFAVVGITLWAPGAASFVGANRQIAELMKQPATPEPGVQPRAFLFHSPTFRF